MPYPEAEAVATAPVVLPPHLAAARGRDLVDQRAVLHQLALRQLQLERAVAPHAHGARAGDLDLDPPRVAPRGDDEVVLDLPVVAVELHVDTRVDAGVSHPGEVRDARHP